MVDLSTLTPQQREIATTVDRPLFVAAGAGSGKTFTLMQRVVWALSPESGPYLDSLDQALIITFTEKAAREIKERVRSGLRAAGLGEEALKVDAAWVSTIHGMCSRILHAHALELGLDPSFTVFGEHRTSEMRAVAVERVLAEVSRDPAYRDLLGEYGARSGAMSPRGSASVAGMVEALVDAAAAAPEGFESLEAVGEPANLPGMLSSLLGSYQLLAAQSIKNEEELLKVADAAARLEDFLAAAPPSSRTSAEVCELLGSLHKPDGRYWRAKAVKEAYAEVRSERARALAEAELARVRPLLGQLVGLARRATEHYDALKRAACGLDNDDLLRHALAALRVPSIAAEYRGRFRLVMVDEFQDTSTQQVEMIKLLSGEGACRLTTVGDSQQSIYRFRGADVGVFRARRAEVSALDPSLVMPMDKNFRSHDDVLRAVRRVCDRPDMIPDFMDLSANDARPDGLAGLDVPRLFLEITTPQGVRVGRSTRFPSSNEQAALSAAQLADRLASFAKAGVPPRDMAVLLRGMSRADLYVEALRARGLDCVVTGGSTFSAAPEVAQVAALLRTLANPHDTEGGLYPVLSGEMFRVDADDIIALRTTTQEQTGEAVSQGIELGVLAFRPHAGLSASPRLKDAIRVLNEAFCRMGSEPVASVLRWVVTASGWMARLEEQGVAGRARAANVLAAVRHVRELTDEMGLGVARASAEFDRWLSVAKEGPASLVGGEADAVRLMTVHASKGLEFPVVAVAECLSEPRASTSGLLALTDGPRTRLVLRPKAGIDTKDVIPDDAGAARTLLEVNLELSERDAEAERQELARLLYVALTRAREALVFSVVARHNKRARDDGSVYSPRMAGPVMEGYLGGEPPLGETAFDFGGSAPGVARHVRLSLNEALGLEGEGGGAFAAAEGPLPHDVHALCRTGAEGPDDDRSEETFTRFEVEEDAAPATVGWSPREDVYSYTSVRASLDAEGGAPAGPAALARAQEDDAADSFDADRATNLGSAFHLCAQRMVEEGLDMGARLGAAEVDAIARLCGVGVRQRARLDAALERWAGSALRARVLGHELVRAEVPFFAEEPSAYGNYVTGAIDLLATDASQAGRALVVDYKTGEREATPAQFRENHELQARLYARVLMDAGYGEVACAFVAVERDEGGEPMVAEYAFSDEVDLPQLRRELSATYEA